MGAWIEISFLLPYPVAMRSLPSWERGLKFDIPVTVFNGIPSLPSWERGLKYPADGSGAFQMVAPLVGAWIEITKATYLPLES